MSITNKETLHYGKDDAKTTGLRGKGQSKKIWFVSAVQVKCSSKEVQIVSVLLDKK